MSVRLSLICWTCGKDAAVVAEHMPQFAFEVADLADKNGWKGVLDINRGRALVFCSHGCDAAARTKSGTYRLRPRRTHTE